jgi:hypothetical protein
MDARIEGTIYQQENQRRYRVNSNRKTSAKAISQVTVRTPTKDGPSATAGTLATSAMPTTLGMLPKARTQKKRQQQKRKNTEIRIKKEKPQIFSPTSRRRVR